MKVQVPFSERRGALNRGPLPQGKAEAHFNLGTQSHLHDGILQMLELVLPVNF